MGVPDGSPETVGTVTGIQITPTQTVFTIVTGPMNLTVTFLSPIEVRTLKRFLFYQFQLALTICYKPDDWVKQSMPFAYLSLEASALDDASHSVQLYSEVTAGQFHR